MTIFGMLFVVLIVAVIVVTEYVVVKWFVRTRVSKMDVLIEKRTFEHISLMKKFPDDAIAVKYFTLGKQSIIDKLLRRYKLRLFEYWNKEEPDEGSRGSEFSVTVSCNEALLLRLKGQIETYDREAAMKAYDYFAQQKRIRGLGLP